MYHIKKKIIFYLSRFIHVVYQTFYLKSDMQIFSKLYCNLLIATQNFQDIPLEKKKKKTYEIFSTLMGMRPPWERKTSTIIQSQLI